MSVKPVEAQGEQIDPESLEGTRHYVGPEASRWIEAGGRSGRLDENADQSGQAGRHRSETHQARCVYEVKHDGDKYEGQEKLGTQGRPRSEASGCCSPKVHGTGPLTPDQEDQNCGSQCPAELGTDVCDGTLPAQLAQVEEPEGEGRIEMTPATTP